MPEFRHLSRRERQVLVGMCEGKTAADMAQELCLSLYTVRNYTASVQAKLGVNSQLAAVAYVNRVLHRPDYERALLVHRAQPTTRKPHECRHCGQAVRKVPGGHGPTYVHDATGAVAGGR